MRTFHENKILIFLFLLTNFFYSECYFRQKNNPYVKKFIPIGAYDIEVFENEKENIIAINYKIREKYPSKKILFFYDDILQKMDVMPYIDTDKDLARLWDREWDNFIDDTTLGSPSVFQLAACWVDRNKTKMYILSIRYYDYTYKSIEEKINLSAPTTDIQHITFQIVPFAEFFHGLK
jgi:hypothetical protein